MRLLINKIRLYKNLLKSTVIISVFLILGICFADSITLTTYYPAPYGNYTKLDTAQIKFGTEVSWSDEQPWPKIVNSPAGDYNCLMIVGKGASNRTVGVWDRLGIGMGNPSYPIHTTNGAYVTTAGVWTNASDISYKTNIIDSRYGLNEVLKLLPREYVMRQDGSHQVGLVAQEVERIIPEVVSGKEGEKGLSYGNLVAVLVKAVQQQQAQIESLKSEIEELKANEAQTYGTKCPEKLE